MSEQDPPILCAGCEEQPVSERWDSDIYCDACLELEYISQSGTFDPEYDKEDSE